MISDTELYSLAIFLGCMAMLLIILYHFLEVNSDETDTASAKGSNTSSKPAANVINPSSSTTSAGVPAGAGGVAAGEVNGKRG